MLFRVQYGLVDMNTDVIQRTRGSQNLRQLQASKDVYKYPFYPRTAVTGTDSLPLLLTSGPSRDSGKASPACLPHSYSPTRQPATCT